MRRIVVLVVFLLLASMASGQVVPSSSGGLYDRLIKVEAPGGVPQLNLSGQVYKVGPFDNKTILDAIAWNQPARDEFVRAFDDRQTGMVCGLVGLTLSLASSGVQLYAYNQPKPSRGLSVYDWWSLGLSLGGSLVIFAGAGYGQQGDQEFYAAINQYNKDVLE